MKNDETTSGHDDDDDDDNASLTDTLSSLSREPPMRLSNESMVLLQAAWHTVNDLLNCDKL